MREALRWPAEGSRAEPNFIVLGVMKGGTSSLYEYLAQHPKISPPSMKEINFFVLNYDLGYRTYGNYFPRRSEMESAKKRMTFEASPSYIFHPLAAKRMHQHLPDIKLVLLLRDPSERAFSHYKQGRRFGWEQADFEEAIQLEPERIRGERERIISNPDYYSYRYFHYSYAARGYYLEQIESFLRVYRRDQLLIVSSERFFRDTRTEFAKILDFLGLDDWAPESFPNMFSGVPAEGDANVLSTLRQEFGPHNEKLYSLLGESLDW